MGDSVFYLVSIARIPAVVLSPDSKVIQTVQPSQLLQSPQDGQANLNGNYPHAWLFQSNPVLYDLRGALCSLKEQVWSVSRYAKQISTGDRIYLWEAGRQGGIAGLAEVIEPARLQPEPPEQLRFARVAEAFAGDRLRARLRILRTIDPMIARQTIVTCPLLRALGVLRCSRGTNFRLSPEDVIALDSLIPSAATA